MADVLTDTAIQKGDPVPLQFKQWFLPDRDKAADWREQAKDDFDFVSGRHYSEDDIKKLVRQKRPPVVFNRIGPVVDAITGYEVGNRRETRYIPREMGDVKANELLTAAGQWFRDQGYADYADSAMFLNVVVCGMGWTETRLDFDQGPSPKPIVEDIDPLEMAWDKNARRRNLKDARRVWRIRRIPTPEAEDMFPGFAPNELNAAWSEVQSEADLDRDEAGTRGTSDMDYVTIVQCQWIEKETYFVAQDPFTGEDAEFNKSEFDTLNKRMKQLTGMELQGARFRRQVRKQAFFGSVVLSVGKAPCDDEFSLQCVTGKFDRNKGTWYGVVRAMKDPQRWANKWLAQMMHIMNSNAKGGIMAEKGAFADPRTAQAEWSSPDSVTLMADGAIAGQKVKEKPQTQFPVGFQQLTEFAIQSIRDVSGVSVEFLGMRESDQPASLEYQRRQAGMNILQWAFDGIKFYRELQGRVILHYLQNDVPEGTLILVAGQEGEKFVPLMRQASKDFDVVVDDAPTSPNQKEAAWAVISSLLPLIGKVIPPAYILKALKYSPLPETIVSELEKMATAPNPAQEEQAATAARAAAAEIEKTQSETMLNMAKAQSEGGRGAIELAKLDGQAANDQRDAVMTMAGKQADQQMAREKHNMTMQKERVSLVSTVAKALQPPKAPASAN